MINREIAKRVLIIGGGAAGMMAAITAAQRGMDVTLLEKNKVLGRKLAITGKGRCNVTNNCSEKVIIENTVTNGSFLYSALNNFPPAELMSFFENLGVPLKTERGNRVFPISDKALSIVTALKKKLDLCSVSVKYNHRVAEFVFDSHMISGVRAVYGGDGKETVFNADVIVLATGGMAYPETGSTGDGYKLALAVGHTINAPMPSLVPIELNDCWLKGLSGLSLRNVELKAEYSGKIIATEFGELLFTHFGISGPIVLSLSASLSRMTPEEISKVRLTINLKPTLSFKALLLRVQRDLDLFSKRHLINSLSCLLPLSLIPVVVGLCKLDPHKQASQISKEERERLVHLIGAMPLSIKKLRPFEEAVITSGGVSVKEVDPKSMRSKLIKNLYFAGELLDVDAYTGGFNLQIAFSTGYTAGINAAM